MRKPFYICCDTQGFIYVGIGPVAGMLALAHCSGPRTIAQILAESAEQIPMSPGKYRVPGMLEARTTIGAMKKLQEYSDRLHDYQGFGVQVLKCPVPILGELKGAANNG